MAKFLNTSGTNFFLEELIKNAKERLILISPYLRLNDRIKELLEDKDRLKIDIRIVYGKSDLHPDEIKWMQKLDYVRVSFCKNLHQIDHSRHRSVNNFMVNIMAAIVAYCLNPNKPTFQNLLKS